MDTTRVLFVCLGNICRSPTAEGVLRARAGARGLAHRLEIDSAGTADWHTGRPPDPRSVRAAQARGIDLSGLRARTLQAADFHQYPLILCADQANLRDARARAPEGAPAEIALLLDWAGLGAGREVPDPWSGDAQGFEDVLDLLEQAADGILQRLFGPPRP